MTCVGRVKAIEDILISLTIKDFWKGISPLLDMTKGEVSGSLKQMRDFNDRAMGGESKVPGSGAPVGLLRIRELSVLSLKQLRDFNDMLVGGESEVPESGAPVGLLRIQELTTGT
jgi:hypothetical protein